MIRKLFLIFLGLIFINVQAQQLQPEEVASFKEECTDLVAYLEFTLNAIGDQDLSPKEKDIIISESYAKFFKDPQVQIEDDLVPDREAITNKDVQSYLKDVDFFFNQAVFSYKILSTDLFQNENNEPYFKVHALRTLSALTIQNDSIYNEQARFIEIVVNPDLRELKIVSIYTTKINEKEENIKWINQAKVWITDNDSGNWINAKEAFYDTNNITAMGFGYSAHKVKHSIAADEEIIDYSEVLKRVTK